MTLQMRKNRTITILAIVITAMLGFFSTNCKKIEPERLIIIKTGTVEEVSQTSCVLSAILLDVGDQGVAQHGFCFSLTSNIADIAFCSEMGSKRTKGEFTDVVNGLTPGTSYHVWAYAADGGETEYGQSLSFDTPPFEKPFLETQGPSEITFNSAHSGGNILSDGGSEITERGVCWNTSPEPNIGHAKTTDGSGPGEFGSNLAPLEPDTKYYIRAYATNSMGTGYGNEHSFTTPIQPIAPEVVTHMVSSIEHFSAWCGGTIASDGGIPILSKGLCWSATEPEPTLADPTIEFGNDPEPFNMEIAGLDHNTEYFVRAYATNSEGTGYGDPVAFRTLFMCGSQLVDERDGQTYFTVNIGEQCWMAENLNVGVMVDVSDVQQDNDILEKHCYNNDISNCDTYGGQYTWDEMMQYTLVEMAQGVCPAGWHIPSDLEWKIMERALGMTVEESDGTSWRGTDEGGQLKSGGTSFWNPPNTGATNTVLFSALPSGMVWNDGSSSGIGDFALFWTSTSILETQAWYRYLHTDETRIYRVDGYRQNSTPVRCVKD